jgi:hypothetical protein
MFRNGPAKVELMQPEIDAFSAKACAYLYGFHKLAVANVDCLSASMSDKERLSVLYQRSNGQFSSAASSRLFQEVNRVANAHPSVAAEFVERLRKWST